MKKLTTRQIVILAVMLLAVLYAGYDFLSKGRKSAAAVDTGKKVEELGKLVNEITATLTKDTPSPATAHMIGQAEAPWPRDPFYEKIEAREVSVTREMARETALAAVKGKILYTGYLDTGRKKIAIINGNEYVSGDALDVEGYVLKSIDPTRITLYNKNTNLTIEIPLQDEWTGGKP